MSCPHAPFAFSLEAKEEEETFEDSLLTYFNFRVCFRRVSSSSKSRRGFGNYLLNFTLTWECVRRMCSSSSSSVSVSTTSM